MLNLIIQKVIYFLSFFSFFKTDKLIKSIDTIPRLF